VKKKASIEIGGKRFYWEPRTTAKQDDYLLGFLRRSGAFILAAGTNLSDGDKTQAILTRLMLSGDTFRVLAGFLVEEGKRWSRADARRNAIAFSDAMDPTEKAALRRELVDFVFEFVAAPPRRSLEPDVPVMLQ
jgi:hypothetical protein